MNVASIPTCAHRVINEISIYLYIIISENINCDLFADNGILLRDKTLSKILSSFILKYDELQFNYYITTCRRAGASINYNESVSIFMLLASAAPRYLLTTSDFLSYK